MNFLERARILTQRGVPVAPALAGDKRCVLQGWPENATLAESQLEAWCDVTPNANTAAVCLSDGICVLDADNDQLAAAVAPLIPPTFTVLSGGKGLPHFYFRHTPASSAFGNCKVMDGDVLLGDFQANRKYVIGPMSELANGGVYRIANDAEIQPVPHTLLEWMSANGIRQKPAQVTPQVQAGTELSQEFDFDVFVAHFQLSGYWKGNWYLLEYCPISGFPHQGSKHTGIYFDGVRLGFHCFAASCPGQNMTFGQVLRHLNQTTKRPFKGEIWKDDSEKWLKNWSKRESAVCV